MGAERVPSGAYLGDRDMFLFLVDGNRDLDDPTDASQAGLFRGFMLRNSDVGAAALTLDVFLFRAVCGNHIIWGFHHMAGFRRRHVGASIHEAWADSLERSAPRSTQTSRPIAPSSCEPPPRSSARRARRWSTRRCSDWICRASTPSTPTRWRNSTSEPAVHLGLRAGADTTQPAHALAGRAVRARQCRQPAPHHGPLTW